MAKRITRQQRRALAVVAPADERTIDRYLSGAPLRQLTRARVEAAIVELGLANLLAEPMTDPDASEDLGR
jgi:hypothetical protein